MVQQKIIFYLAIIIFSSSFVSSAHYVVGVVWNSTNGTSPDNRSVTAWNPSLNPCFKNLNNNISDIIGSSGASGSPNVFMLDSDVLGLVPAQQLRIALTDNLYYYTDVIITGAGSDYSDNFTYNTTIFQERSSSVCPSSSSIDIFDSEPSIASVIIKGGSFSDVLKVYNPLLYENLSIQFKALFSGNYSVSFPQQLALFFQTFVRYVAKEQAVLVPKEVNQTQ